MASPLIGVVTHELRAEARPAWAPAPGRRERDLAPQRLALRLSYTQAVQEAGGVAVVVPTRVRRRHGGDPGSPRRPADQKSATPEFATKVLALAAGV